MEIGTETEEKRENMLTVSQLNLYIKQIIDSVPMLNGIVVKGEISNCKIHSSGHIYMSLKDESSVIRAVMFRSSASKLNFTPKNGIKVMAKGRISVYERDGQYQLYVDYMMVDGIGDLHLAFEQLKQKLNAEGLFAPEHKKKLPKYPKKVGVVTAPTGAAIRDIINVLSRRFSYSDILIYPVLVQGVNAAESIVKAIEYFNEFNAADVLIVGRGGGSIEDLWAFNEEIVARAIYKSEIPIVSAVGHEIDFTISDFAADLRAPTPSAAAELVVPSQTELIEKFNNVYSRLTRCALNIIEKKRFSLKYLEDKNVIKNPNAKLDEKRMYIDSLTMSLDNLISKRMMEKQQSLGVMVSKLDGLSPLGTIARGFSVAKTSDNKVIKRVEDVNSGDKISVVVENGEINATVD